MPRTYQQQLFTVQSMTGSNRLHSPMWPSQG